ncbi:MAG: UDP-N-acetylmuramoyl-L-alanyl-D-glutamate--2,6-diaminopimelate ligase [Gammaproteobacteria bacterium]|nr:UDP-N-acetylmuramoyl-L-alanyl-D-glutamate--2,6-diaminopimelate ligase [Gammaproteobacteria bacterium]
MMTASASMVSMSLSELLPDLVSATVDVDRVITGLSLDSRTVQKGDLFLACAGYQVHGSVFVADAIQAGAVAVLLEVMSPAEEQVTMQDIGVPCIPVYELNKRMGLIAARFYRQPSADMMTVGITGTDGKTSCSHFIAQSIHLLEGVCGLVGTLGYGLYGRLFRGQHTTPDALRLQWELAEIRAQKSQMVVMEVSSHALSQGRVNGVSFDIAVLTNLGRDHLDFHGDMKAYADAKRSLFQTPGLSHVVLNLDDELGQALVEDVSSSTAVIVYGMNPDRLKVISRPVLQWVWADIVTMGTSGMTIYIDSSWGQGDLHTCLLGRFNVSNLLATLSVLLIRGVGFEQALACLANVTTVAGRMEQFGGGEQALVVVDYAHTPGALEAALKALREHCRGKLWCVFGAGGDRDTGKRPLMGQVAEKYADYVVVTDDNPRNEDATQIVVDILSQMEHADDVYVERGRAHAIEYAISCASKGDVILVAGKGHETEQVIAGKQLRFSDREQVLYYLQGDAQ